MKKKEKRNSMRPWLILAGAVAGGAAVYYLNTPKGKKFRKDVAKKTGKITHDMKEKFDHTLESASEVTHDILDKANDVKKNLISGLQEKTYDRLDSFEKGITKAKKKLHAEAPKA